MGLRIMEAKYGNADVAVLYCSTTDWAFGPIIHEHHDRKARVWIYAHDVAELFLDYCQHTTGERDIRGYGWDDKRISNIYGDFRTALEANELCECGHSAEHHDWSSGSHANHRKCREIVRTDDPAEDGGYREDDCECTGGWQPKRMEAKA